MAIANSSPIITLGKTGKLALLHKLFGDIIIAERVYEEIMLKPENPESIAVKEAIEQKWLKIQKSQEINKILGSGEASSIQLALNLKQTLIMDDKRAVFVANTFGIECHGTLYVVLEALKKRIIKSKKEAIDLVNELIQNNLYLSTETLSEFYSLLEKIKT